MVGTGLAPLIVRVVIDTTTPSLPAQCPGGPIDEVLAVFAAMEAMNAR